MNEEPKDIKSIFAEALEKKTAKERAAYLDKSCEGDGDLRSKVEALLKAHDEAGDFLEVPAVEVDATLDTPRVTEGPGTRIGRYKLLQLIGEGGFGAVYMTEQEEPIRRRVALKIIKLGMDTKQVIARFEAERQALAMMDHANIARVFDAGATDTGRPYFVMELVKGIPITEYCDKNNLDTRQRLDLFIDVCKAVQHAHQKGIIHRDIKPSNVMITLHDGKPVPKIIDFGIAKATQHRLTEKTLFTEYKQFIGTPEYMSPEQAEMSGLDVDTRSDIYSLGVLLYELLTGTTPFEPEKLRSAAYDEIRRIIREDEPPRPSTRLDTLGDALTDVAKHRHVQPEQLCKIVRGDLDWVVMKALEKDRTRRYETANEFAQDIGRHLGDEPVSAGPPSVGYRLRKFVRRNRAPVTAAAAVTAAIIVGLVVSTVLYFQADQAWKNEGIARVKADEAQITAENAQKTAEAARKAEARQKTEALNRLVDHYEEQGRQYMESSRLDEALVFLNEAYQLDNQRPSLQFLLAESQRRLNNPVFLENKGPMAWEEIAKYGPAKHFAFNAVGDRVVGQGGYILYEPSHVGLWDATTGKFIEGFGFPGCCEFSYFGGFSADGRQFLVLPTSHFDYELGPVQLRASSDGHLITTLRGSRAYFSADDEHIITLAEDGQFRIFDSTNWELQTVLKANLVQERNRHDLSLYYVKVLGRLRDRYFSISAFAQVSRDGSRAVTLGNPNGWGQVWDMRTGKCLYSIKPEAGAFVYGTLSPDGRRLLTSRLALKEEPVPRFVSTAQKSHAVPFKENSKDPNAIKNSEHEEIKFDEEIAEIWCLDEGKRLMELDRSGFGQFYGTAWVNGVPLRGIYLSFSPDGMTVTSYVRDENRLRVWDIETGTLLWQTEVSSATYSPDGKQVITGDSEGHVVVRDTRTGERLGDIIGHQYEVKSIRFYHDDSDVRVVTEDTHGKCMVHTWPHAELAQEDIDPEKLSFQTILSYERKNPSVRLAYTSRGDRVLIAGATGKVRIVPTDTSAASFSRFNVTASAFSVSPDRKFIALVDKEEGTINVFDTDAGQQRARWDFPGEDFEQAILLPWGGQLVFTPTGRHIILKSYRENLDLVRVLDIQTSRVVVSIERGKPWEKISELPNGYRNLLTVHESFYFSPNGRILALAEFVSPVGEPNSPVVASELHLWDIESGQRRVTIANFDSPISSIAFSPDSTQLVTATTSGMVQLWETRTGRLAKTITQNIDAEYVFFSPDAKRMITLPSGEESPLWDTNVWKQIMTFPGPAHLLWARFSPDGQRIVGSSDLHLPRRSWFITATIAGHPNAWLWDAADGRLVTTLLGREVRNWHFTPDSKRMITRHEGGGIKVWDIEDGSLIHAPPPLKEEPVVADVSLDSRWFVTHSSWADKTQIWDLSTGRPLTSYEEKVGGNDLTPGAMPAYMDRIFAFSCRPPGKLLRFNADGSRLITGLGLRDISLEKRSSEEIRKWVEAHVPLRLTGGRFRSATPEEMYRVELDFRRYTLGEEHPETLDSKLSLKVYLVWESIEAGKLKEASQLVEDLRLWMRQKNSDIAKHRRDIVKQLSSAYYNRGGTEVSCGEFGRAASAFEEADRLDSGNASVLNELAWLQATCPAAELRNGAKAVENATKACELTNWDISYCINTLAAAYAEAGDFDSAVKWQKKAIDLLTEEEEEPSEWQAEWGVDFEECLKLYQSGKPYRESPSEGR